VVEDDAPVRAIVQETLEHYGYEVIAAERGATALQGAAAHPGAIDLVLTDVILPGISGLEVWNRLRARHPSARVIFMSGYPQGTAGGAPAALEGVEYLPKPFTPGQLAARVRDVLGGD
jgi:DNA-binding response OmpR family regulator